MSYWLFSSTSGLGHPVEKNRVQVPTDSNIQQLSLFMDEGWPPMMLTGAIGSVSWYLQPSTRPVNHQTDVEFWLLGTSNHIMKDGSREGETPRFGLKLPIHCELFQLNRDTMTVRACLLASKHSHNLVGCPLAVSSCSCYSVIRCSPKFGVLICESHVFKMVSEKHVSIQHFALTSCVLLWDGWFMFWQCWSLTVTTLWCA